MHDLEGNSIAEGPRQESPKTFNEAFEQILHESPIIGTGKDGIVLKVDTEKMDPSTLALFQQEGLDFTGNLAAKILKIYRPGEGKREFDFHMRAYELLSGVEEAAKIPKPILLKMQHLSTSDRDFLNKAGARLEDEAEIMLMDYIEGADIANLIYVFIMQKIGYDQLMIDSLSIEDKHKIVGNHLDFDVIEEENVYVEALTSINNANKLIGFLQQHGFSIEKTAIEKLEVAVKILEENGIFHNDLSERNAMITKDGTPYIIDFGRTTDNKEDHLYDDHALMRRLREISAGKSIQQKTTHKNETDKTNWMTNSKRITTNPRWAKTIPIWEKGIASTDYRVVENSINAALSDETYLNQVFAAITNIILRSDNKDGIKSVVSTLLSETISKNKSNPFARSKLERFSEFVSDL